MTVRNREQELAKAFVELTDTVAEDFDPVVLLDRLAGHCESIAGADAVGIMVAGSRGDLRTLTVTDEDAAVRELFQLQSGEGPCLDCYRSHAPVDAPDLASRADRWPHLAPLGVRSGYRSAHALPLRVNDQTIGAVSLLHTAPGGLQAEDLGLAQALADVAAVALFQWSPDPARPTDVLTRVQATIAAKATVDMAQGMLAEHAGLDFPDALRVLYAYSGRRGGRLTDIAQALVRRTLDPETVLTGQG